MPYQTGTAFVNEAGNIGYVALNIDDLVAEPLKDADSIMGMLGSQYAELVKNPAIKKQLKKIFAATPVSLFYSKARSGIEILTMPGMGDKNKVDNYDIKGLIIGAYSTSGGIPSVKDVYDFHSKLIDEMELLSDESILRMKVKALPKKANAVYDKLSKIADDFTEDFLKEFDF
ncbi:MAG: hypothetical protein NTV63_04180 [Candidatus Woesearchaeota archaeon]|nr:hypothetical protein [Candidatus Woesearchaeota archaeon]